MTYFNNIPRKPNPRDPHTFFRRFPWLSMANSVSFLTFSSGWQWIPTSPTVTGRPGQSKCCAFMAGEMLVVTQRAHWGGAMPGSMYIGIYDSHGVLVVTVM